MSRESLSITGWLSRTKDDITSHGRLGIERAWHSVWTHALSHALSPPEDQDYVFEEDWDILIVLDGCRVDLMAEVVDEYDFLEDIGVRHTPGTNSPTWMAENFSPEYTSEMASTIMVSGNPHTEQVVDESAFQLVKELWKSDWDDSIDVIRPRPITDWAIHLGRQEDHDRMIVHYMQPHQPFLGSGLEKADGGATYWLNLLHGTHSKPEMWRAYRENLRHVLLDVGLLLNNLDGNAVITSDHGNCIGEWGVYGHPPNVPLTPLVEVPWVETTATDTHEYRPDVECESEVDADVSSRLESLGYV